MTPAVSFLRTHRLFSFGLISLLLGLALYAIEQNGIARIIASTAALIGISVYAYQQIGLIRTGNYGLNVLAPTAVVTAVLLHQPWSALGLVITVALVEAILQYAQARATTEIKTLKAQLPTNAQMVRSRKVVAVKASSLKTGDKVLISDGKMVPADAVIIEGSSVFSTQLLLGEQQPQPRTVGDRLLAGSTNVGGDVTARITETKADSQINLTIRTATAAALSQAPLTRIAQLYTLPFSFMVLSVASAAWIVTGESIRFLDVLIVATPGPLLFVAPLAINAGMSRLLRYGIGSKNSSAIQRLADARTIAFSKVGIVTSPNQTVDRVQVFGSHSAEYVLTLAASIEQASEHSVGRAIVAAALKQNLKLIKAKHVTVVNGQGVSAQLQGHEVVVGRLGLLAERGVTIPQKALAVAIADTTAYVAINHELAGIIILKNSLTNDIKLTLERIKSAGITRSLLLSGGNKAAALAVAKQAGIATVKADLLPASKLKLLEATKDRPLVYVADGVSEALFLPASDVGIAIGAAESIAAGEAADVVILSSNVSKVATALLIAQRSFRIARLSTLLGVVASLVAIGAFATGAFPPLAGVLVQGLIDVVVIALALRAHSARGESI